MFLLVLLQSLPKIINNSRLFKVAHMSNTSTHHDTLLITLPQKATREAHILPQTRLDTLSCRHTGTDTPVDILTHAHSCQDPSHPETQTHIDTETDTHRHRHRHRHTHTHTTSERISIDLGENQDLEGVFPLAGAPSKMYVLKWLLSLKT